MSNCIKYVNRLTIVSLFVSQRRHYDTILRVKVHQLNKKMQWMLHR
jgi:hypothetical protein